MKMRPPPLPPRDWTCTPHLQNFWAPHVQSRGWVGGGPIFKFYGLPPATRLDMYSPSSNFLGPPCPISWGGGGWPHLQILWTPPPHEIGHVPPIFKFFGPPPPQDWTCTPHLQFFFGGAPPPSQDWTPASIHVELQRRELTANPSDRFWNLEFQRSALLYMYIPTTTTTSFACCLTHPCSRHLGLGLGFNTLRGGGGAWVGGWVSGQVVAAAA